LNKNESDEGKFIRTRSPFYQALRDNIRQRFACIDFLSNIQVLDKSHWPDDKVEKTYGDREVSSLCKDLGFKAKYIVNILFEYSEYKKKDIMKSKIALLHRLLNIYRCRQQTTSVASVL